MKNLSNITSMTSTPTATASRSSVKEDGFQKQLNEILFAAKEKEAGMKNAKKEKASYSLSDLDKSSNSHNQMNATKSAQSHLSANMLGLYTAQENKNEKSGKGRAVAASSAI